MARIEIGDLAQQQRLARPRRAGDGGAFARRQIQADGRQAFAVDAAQPEHGRFL
ncbi:hypothetical protein WJ978_23525 [Achromobacter xylosoxidans]